MIFDRPAADVSARNIRLRICSRTDNDLTGELALPEPGQDGEVDLGVIQVGDLLPLAFKDTESPVVVTGRVVTTDGAPLVGAWIRAERPHDSDLEWFSTDSTSSDENGEFRLCGAVPEGPLQLTVEHDGHYLPSPIVFEGRLLDAVVTLAPAARLRARFALPAGVAPDSLEVRVEGPPVQAGGGLGFLDDDGVLEMDGLTPGVGALVANLLGQTVEVVRIEDLRFRAGEECRDPRLARIDLTARIQLRRIAVRDPSGAPIDSAQVVMKAWGSDRATGWVDLSESGDGVVPSLPGPLDMLVLAPGFRGQRIRLDGESLEVRLVRVTSAVIHVEVRNPQALPKPPLFAFASMRWVESDRPEGTPFADWDPRDASQPQQVDRNGRCNITVTEPGRYRLDLYEVSSGQKDWSPLDGDLGLDPDEVVVKGDGAPHTVRVTYTPSAR